MQQLHCGLEASHVSNINEFLGAASEEGFDFVTVPLAHPRNRRAAAKDVGLPFTRSDLLLSSDQWTSYVVGAVSKWIAPDAKDAAVRRNSEACLRQELAWAAHLGLPAVVLPAAGAQSATYAGLVHEYLTTSSAAVPLWLRVPMTLPADVDASASRLANGRASNDPWEHWNRFRTLCDEVQTLSVCLEVTEDVPSMETVDKWCGEPISVVVLPTHVFQTNAKGFPILSKPHQAMLEKFFRHKIQFVLRGRAGHPDGLEPYVQYLRHKHEQFQETLTETERFESPYYDFLQAPLQPLADNLESQTYETFEKDPVKYAQYELAVHKALLDRTAGDETKVTVLMVVGAGRGPLVRASLRAGKSANRPLRVYAVEKNPNAIVTLRNMHRNEGWGDRVTIVSHDMRTWQAPEQADVLVSELLGSFGDNELSPECLDGAQRFLKDDGISIPAKYTSYLAPMMSEKLHNDVKAYKDLKHWETSYVVKIHNAAILAKSKPCFTFVHPNRDEAIDNSRYESLSWTVPQAATLHGLAGYFDAQLYDDVYISIDEHNFSTGMFSWFPLYFPIKSPMYVPPGATVEAHMWRKAVNDKVWYEWAVTAPDVSPIHNPGGRSSTILL